MHQEKLGDISRVLFSTDLMTCCVGGDITAVCVCVCLFARCPDDLGVMEVQEATHKQREIRGRRLRVLQVRYKGFHVLFLEKSS